MNIFEMVRALHDFRQSQSLFSVRSSFVHRQARCQRSVMGVALVWESGGESPSLREFCGFFFKINSIYACFDKNAVKTGPTN